MHFKATVGYHYTASRMTTGKKTGSTKGGGGSRAAVELSYTLGGSLSLYDYFGN